MVKVYDSNGVYIGEVNSLDISVAGVDNSSYPVLQATSIFTEGGADSKDSYRGYAPDRSRTNDLSGSELAELKLQKFKDNLRLGLESTRGVEHATDADVDFARNFIITKGKVVYHALNKFKHSVYGYAKRDTDAANKSVDIFYKRYGSNGNPLTTVANKLADTYSVQDSVADALISRFDGIKEDMFFKVMMRIPFFVHSLIRKEIIAQADPNTIYMPKNFWLGREQKLNFVVKITAFKRPSYDGSPETRGTRVIISAGGLVDCNSIGCYIDDNHSPEDKGYWSSNACKGLVEILNTLRIMDPELDTSIGSIVIQHIDKDVEFL